MFEITLPDRIIRARADQKFQTRNGWKSASDLKAGDDVNYGNPRQEQWLQIQKVEAVT